MKAMPFDASFFRFGNHNIPDQMAEVDRALRFRRRVKDVSRSSVSLKVRVEIFLYNSDDRHRSLAAGCLRILDQFAVYDGAFDVQNLLLPVVISPPKSLQFFRAYASER